MAAPLGRFAPTPSGFLHLGNVFCSLLAWLHCKSQGGKILLRIEDLDPQRCSLEKADALARDLEWLGLTWDCGAYMGPDSSRYFQSNRSEIYHEYFQRLVAMGLAYPCFCSRNQLHAASAPHASDGRLLYSGACRSLTKEQQQERARTRLPAYRVQVPDEAFTYTDLHYGSFTSNLAADVGDFIIRRSDGVHAYQLAVVVDDGLMGVTQVVRGSDLLDSTPMQLFLYKQLGLKAPEFFHIPLLTAADGRRLAKRDGDLELAALRRKFHSPEPILGYLGYLAGLLPRPEPVTALDLLPLYDPRKVPQANIIVPQELYN